jgi:hypothetical protein
MHSPNPPPEKIDMLPTSGTDEYVDIRQNRALSRRSFILTGTGWTAAGLIGLGQDAKSESAAKASLSSDVQEKLERADMIRRGMMEPLEEDFKKLAGQYVMALEKLKLAFQSVGKLEAILAVDSEIAAVAPGVTIQEESILPEIAKLQRTYSAQVSRIVPQYREMLVRAETEFSIKLEELVRLLTLSGRADEAGKILKFQLESTRRTKIFKEMASKRTNHLILNDEALCRIIEIPLNDGKPLVRFNTKIERRINEVSEEIVSFKEAISSKTSPEINSILEFDIPPGFAFLSVIGGGAFSGYIWSQLIIYELQIDTKPIAKFTSQGVHWIRIVRIPSNAKSLSLIIRKNHIGDTPDAFWAWPRLHTGFGSVLEETGWPASILKLYRESNSSNKLESKSD